MKKTLSHASRSLSEQSESKCNGMEREDEIAGLGNVLNFGARNYDSRIARFMSLDFYRKRFASQSAYLISRNNPINFIDLNGHYAINPNASADWGATMASMIFGGPEAAGETAALCDANNSLDTKEKEVTIVVVKKASEIAAEGFIVAGKSYINTIGEFLHYLGPAGVLRPVEGGGPFEYESTPYSPIFPEAYDKSDKYVDFAEAIIPYFRISMTYYRVLSKFRVTRYGIAVAEWVNKASKMTEKMFKALPEKGMIDPTLLRFSQETHSKYFKDKSLVSDLVKKLKKNPKHAKTVEPITIVQNPKDGLIYSVDNRRLRAGQEAGVELQYKKVEWDDLTPNQIEHFDTPNKGEVILERDPDVKKID